MVARLALQQAGTLTVLPQAFSKARPGISICACTEARQDTARYSVSMRNSKFKDCCLPVLVYNRSSWSEWVL